MASKRISELSAISALDEDDVLVVVEDGATRKVTVAQLRTALFAGCKLVEASLTVANGGFPGSVVAFDGGDLWDTHGFHDPASNNSRITIPTGMGGIYMVGGTIYWGSGSASGDRALYTKVNGGSPAQPGTRFAGATGNNDAISTFAEPISLSAGDYVELNPYQETGGDLTGCTAYFWVEKRT